MTQVITATTAQPNVNLEIDGKVLPIGAGIYSAVIRTDLMYALPMLDLVLTDTIGAIGSAIKLLDGTLIKCAISQSETNTVTPLVFKVAKVTPTKVGTVAYYHISACMQSDLLQPKSSWVFTGSVADAFADIVTNDATAAPVKFITNYINTQHADESQFKKLATQSFSAYMRRVLLPSMTATGVSYWAYYHDGYNCKLLDLLQLLANYQYKDGDPAMSPNNFLQWTLNSDSFHKNVNNASYGGSVWQYNAEDGAWVVHAEALGQAKYNVNKDATVKNEQVFIASSSTGNHPVDYLQSVTQNMKNHGVFNIELIVQVNYQTNLEGLSVLPVFYDKSKYIPFIVAGKSIIMRNGMYEEQLKLIANQIDQSVLAALGAVSSQQ